MHRGDTCLVVDRSRSTDVEDLVRAGEAPRELRVLRENGSISVGTPMSYDRMSHKRSGDGRAALAVSVVLFAMAAVTTAIFAGTFAPVRRTMGRLRASARSARRARPRSRTARILWGRGTDADPN